MYLSSRFCGDVCRCVCRCGGWFGQCGFVVVVDCSVVLSFICKSKYAGFSLSMETVSNLLFMVSLKYLGCLSTTWKGPE